MKIGWRAWVKAAYFVGGGLAVALLWWLFSGQGSGLETGDPRQRAFDEALVVSAEQELSPRADAPSRPDEPISAVATAEAPKAGGAAKEARAPATSPPKVRRKKAGNERVS
jgi:hypothetical protein